MQLYLQLGDGAVLRRSDCAIIPNDPANLDRVEFNAWVAAGGVADPYRAPLSQIRQRAARTEFLARKLEREGKVLEAYNLRRRP
jgi:hypothetical protein